jgi:hypothetical protein
MSIGERCPIYAQFGQVSGSSLTVFTAGQDVTISTGQNFGVSSIFVKGNSGQVGIGTSSPGSTLDINGNLNISGFNGVGAVIISSDNAGPVGFVKNLSSSGSSSIQFYDDLSSIVGEAGYANRNSALKGQMFFIGTKVGRVPNRVEILLRDIWLESDSTLFGPPLLNSQTATKA